MTDHDTDDFEFDEDGIYREKQHFCGSQTDILLDEQGIWREDPPTSFPLYTSDSGLGTTCHKSTSSLLSRVDDESVPNDQHNLDDHRSAPGDWTSSVNPLDSEVYNISELEASDVGPDELVSDDSDVEFHDGHEGSVTPENYDGQLNDSGDGDSDRFVNHQHLSLPHQSLVEFEEFETAMDHRGSTERSHDDADLIGAYLQRLSEQDSVEEDGVCRQDATSDWLDQQMCASQQSARTKSSRSHDVSHDRSQLNSAREEGAVERSVSSPSYQGSTQLTQIPMLSMSQSPRKTDSPRTPFLPNSHRSISSTEGGRCLPSTPLRNPSVPPQIVIRQQSQGSEEGAAREMDVAASLLLGEEAFFAEFSGDIFGTSAEGDRASHDSEKDDNDMEYDGQQNRDSQTRQAEESTNRDTHTSTRADPGMQRSHDQTPPAGNMATHSRQLMPPGGSANARSPKDMARHVENEETLTQLQKEYNSLLRKYAEAENTIDELRLGAKVNLYSDSPTPQQGQLGSLGGAHHAQTLSIGRMGAGSLTVPAGGHGYINSAVGSRPDSRASQLSGSIWSMHENLLEPTEPGRSSPFARDSTKLALWAKSKGVQEQTEAFKILLSEDHLTIEDQQRALQNIKNGYEKLQQSYRDAKDEHDFEVRQGMLRGEGGGNEGFDDAKELEGELYKLGMVLDDLDHTVEGNSRRRPSKRVPFQGTPVKADHSIDVQAMQTSGRGKSADDGEGVGLGGVAGIDGRLQELEESYESLMERYERLKRMSKTPSRDAELSRLLKKLCDIHEGNLDTAEMSTSHPRQDSNHWGNRHSQGPASSSSTGQDDQTELESSDESGSQSRDHRRSYLDKNRHQVAEPGRKGRQQPQPPVGARRWGTGGGSHNGAANRRLRPPENAKQQFKGHLHGDRDDKDSGYMGSETSRRTQQSRGVDPRLLAPSGVSSRQDNDDSLDSESESDASTVTERVRPHRPKSAATRGGGTGTSPQKSRSRRGMLAVSEAPPVGHSESEEVSRISGAVATQAIHNQGASQRGQGQLNGQVTSSMVSQHIAGVNNVQTWPTTADPLVQTHGRHGNQSHGLHSNQSHGLHGNHGLQPHSSHGTQGLQQTASQSSQPHGNHSNHMLPPQSLYSNQVLQPNALLGNQIPQNMSGANNPVHQDPRTRVDHPGATHPMSNMAASSLRPQSRAATYGTTVSSMRPTDEFMNGASVNPYLEAARDFFHQLNEGGDVREPEDRYVDQKYERRNNGTCAREFIRSPYQRQHRRLYDFDGDDSTYSPAPYREPAPYRDSSHYDRTTRGSGFLSEPELPASEQNPYYSPRDGSRRSRMGRDVEDGGRYPGRRTGTRRGESPGRVPPADVGFEEQGNVAGAVYQLQAAPCPTCGGVGYHTHGEYVYAPPPMAVQPPVVLQPPIVPPQPPVPAPVAGTNIVGTFVPAGRPPTPSAAFTPATWNPAGQAVSNGQMATFVVAAPPNGTQTTPLSGATYIPCQLVTPPRQQHLKRTPPVSPSVRYYVRQYGAKSKTRSPRPGHRHHHESTSSDEEDTAELDESLSGALRTAKQLKKISRKMKKNLSVELSRSYFETSLVSGY